MEHQHRHYRFGDTFHCICGDSFADPRTDEERERDMERATLQHKVDVNRLFGVASPSMEARIVELAR